MKRATIALVLASGCMLGGCQQFHSMFAGKPARTETAAIDMSGYFAERLEAGRRHLQRNRPTQAVTAFRQASYDPAVAGSAYNGMGIAYAQMGRGDLARRYFIAAIEVDPTDERFSRNLARLDGGLPLAAPTEALALAEAPPAAPLANPAVGPVSATAEQSRTETNSTGSGPVRVSNREVTISTSSTASRPPVFVSARAERSATASSQVTVEGRAASRAVKPAYPVRLVLADVSQPTRPSYPVRIELPEAK